MIARTPNLYLDFLQTAHVSCFLCMNFGSCHFSRLEFTWARLLLGHGEEGGKVLYNSFRLERGFCHSVLNVQAKKDPDEDKRRKGEVGKMHKMHKEGAVLCIAASDLVHRQPWWGGSLKRVWLRFLGKEVGIINVNLENSREVWQKAKHFAIFFYLFPSYS